MSITSLLSTPPTGEVQFITPAGGAVFSIDCSTNETHSRKSIPSEFEIENGQTISDHMVLKPFDLKLVGVITDTPFNLDSLVQSFATTAISSVTPSVGVLGKNAGALALVTATIVANNLKSNTSPSIEAYRKLLQLQSMALPFNVLTSLFLYRNMWISDISVPRDNKTGKCLVFDVSLVQLLLVSSSTVSVAGLTNAALSAAKANRGSTEPEDASYVKAGVAKGVDTVGASQQFQQVGALPK